MIDLAQGSLPSELVVGGEAYGIDTSFRTWLRVQRKLESTGAWDGSIFLAAPPRLDWRPAAREFLASENPCPHGTRGGGARALDLLADGDLVVAAFQQAYGIDLTAGDMHWHRFLALLRGLPSDTLLSQVMGIRSWVRTDERGRLLEERERLRSEWALPREDDAALVALQGEWLDGIDYEPVGED